jgi:cytochrome o ubiquinol oxidase subunit 2
VKLALVGILIILAIAGLVIFAQHFDIPVLQPRGEIAHKQRDIIAFTVGLSALVVVPVFIMLALFAWKYREGNTKAKYRPDWDANNYLEALWWGVPCVIIVILGVMTWQTSHELDPYKPLDSETKPIEIQVVALQWKWLFIYPEQGIASVNLLQFPEKTPLNFTITADAPMNSFWIPSLGGQVYAMSGMSTKLHLIADATGDYRGSSANISGAGFADMSFSVQSRSVSEFAAWVQRTKQSAGNLDMSVYTRLAQPAVVQTPQLYTLADNSLYHKIVMKYMTPDEPIDAPAHDHTMHMPAMEGM